MCKKCERVHHGVDWTCVRTAPGRPQPCEGEVVPVELAGTARVMFHNLRAVGIDHRITPVRSVPLPEELGITDAPVTENDRLLEACESGNARRAAAALARGAEPDFSLGAPLRAAAELGHAEVARLLLKAGATPDLNHGECIHFATENGHAEVLQMLQEALTRMDVDQA